MFFWQVDIPSMEFPAARNFINDEVTATRISFESD